jgi:hypothetical protein
MFDEKQMFDWVDNHVPGLVMVVGLTRSTC